MAKIKEAVEGYTHSIPAMPQNMFWARDMRTGMVDRVADLSYVIPQDVGVMAFDLETSSLSPEEGFVVGASMTFDGYVGWYVPICHQQGPRLEKEALDVIYRAMQRAKRVLFYNARFDMRFMESAGFPMGQIPYFDVATLVHLSDTNVRLMSLKQAERHFLGWIPPSFADTLGDNPNLFHVEPNKVVEYAAIDALGTYHLYYALYPELKKECGGVVDLDNRFLYPLMKCEEQKTRIDPEVLRVIDEKLKDKILNLERECHTLAGREFSLTSPFVLREILIGMGIDTMLRTSTGLMQINQKSLKRLAKTVPFIQKLIEFRKAHKARTAYTLPLLKIVDGHGPWVRFSYHPFIAPTSRLAGGKDKKNPYFSPFNIQSCKKGDVVMLRCKHTGATTEDAIFGWEFSEDPEFSDLAIEGYARDNNVRMAFLPDPGHLFVSIDFSGQEIRAAAILSGEDVWLDALKKGEDIHKNTALAIYGEENYNKEKRKLAKFGNFGVLYGQTEYAFAQMHDLTEEDAHEFFTNFWSKLKKLAKFIEESKTEGWKRGTVYSLFGRPRRVAWYLNHQMRKIKSFGERTCVNGKIQSSGADILKIAMINVHRHVLTNPSYMNDVRFLSTIHDEINFSVSRERAHEIVDRLVRVMTIEGSMWPIKFEVGLSLGTRWGNIVEWRILEDGTFEPKYEKAAH